MLNKSKVMSVPIPFEQWTSTPLTLNQPVNVAGTNLNATLLEFCGSRRFATIKFDLNGQLFTGLKLTADFGRRLNVYDTEIHVAGDASAITLRVVPSQKLI